MTKKPSAPPDPLRTEMLELIQKTTSKLAELRDHAGSPGNIWLAKSDLDGVNQLIGELEQNLNEIKKQDSENGY
jgi:hypothetical protein